MDGFYNEADCDLDAFADLIARDTARNQVPHAAEVQKAIPIYDVPDLQDVLSDQDTRRILMAEWARILHSGAGVFILRAAQPDHEAIDRATEVFNRIIADEAGHGADHFAAAGSNDRIWNSLQKLCLADPDCHVRYFASPAIDAACEAWLGPNYQMTAQVNVVHPGGAAQQAHRDYHLGFQTAQVSATYPAHVHDLSPLMTLQGGLAHGEVPLISGPTKLLPFSQTYRPGYAAWRRDDFRAHFEAHHVQLPMSKGDAMFFNPALFHAAGANTSEDIHRMVNLFQISSPFGRAMESINRIAMTRAAFPALLARKDQLSNAQQQAVIAATAEGYAFPTNLDTDPPIGGLAPQSQQDVLKQAVRDGWAQSSLDSALDEQAKKQWP